MEVLFHLVEEEVFTGYLEVLFDSAECHVVICSNGTDSGARAPHERYRSFTAGVATNRPQWQLVQRVDPPPEVALMSSMYLYSARTAETVALLDGSRPRTPERG